MIDFKNNKNNIEEEYEIDNDTSFVKSLIIMEATNFSENVALNKSIKQFLFRNIEWFEISGKKEFSSRKEFDNIVKGWSNRLDYKEDGIHTRKLINTKVKKNV